jgi:glucokinase
MAEPCLLVGDIGGTNARFAVADTKMPGFSREKAVRCADYASAGEAIRAYLRGLDVAQPTVICLAAVGEVIEKQ